MNRIQDLIDLLRRQIAPLRAQGATNVTIVSLEELLNLVERLTTQIPPQNIAQIAIENARLRQEHDLAVYEQQVAQALELFRSVIKTAVVCARTLLVMNGASAVALLAFIGHLATDPTTQPLVSQFAPALRLFLYGVLTAGSFSGFLAFAQWTYNRRWQLFGHINSTICILSGAASLILFVVGARCGAHALQHFAVRQSISFF